MSAREAQDYLAVLMFRIENRSPGGAAVVLTLADLEPLWWAHQHLLRAEIEENRRSRR